MDNDRDNHGKSSKSGACTFLAGEARILCLAVEEAHKYGKAGVSGNCRKHTQECSSDAAAEDVGYILKSCKSQ